MPSSKTAQKVGVILWNEWKKCIKNVPKMYQISLWHDFFGDLVGFQSDFMGFYGDLVGFYNDLMGFYSDFMGFYGDLVGFYNDFMGF